MDCGCPHQRRTCKQWKWKGGQLLESRASVLDYFQRSEIYATKGEFDHICVFPYERVCAIDVWSRSSFQVTTCKLPQCWCRQNSRSCTDDLLFTDCECNQTNFRTFWLHLLHMNLFHWFYWYNLWPKVVFKMSQDFRPPPSVLTII